MLTRWRGGHLKRPSGTPNHALKGDVPPHYQTPVPGTTTLKVDKYCMLTTNLLRCINIDINNWLINVEEEAGNIDTPSASVIHFELGKCTFDVTHIPVPRRGTIPDTNPATGRPTDTKWTTAPWHARTTIRTGHVWWTPPYDLMLLNGIVLRQYIISFQCTVKHLTALDSGHIMCIYSYLWDRCSYNLHKH